MIKFCMWSESLQVMYTPDMESGMWGVDKMPNGVYKESSNEILLQYTDLDDIKGVSIYDKNIVRVSDEEECFSEQFSMDYDWVRVGVVKKICGSWVVGFEDKTEIPFCAIINSDIEIEVIGTLFENSELLELE